MTVSSDLATDNRVHRSCTLLQELGFEVVLLGRIKKDSPEMPPRSYKYRRFRLPFEKGAFFYAALNARLFMFLLFSKRANLFANDLDTLPAAYLISKIKRLPLVYDSHELFTEVPELVERPRIQKIWLSIEQWIFPNLKHIITVNASIAQIFHEKYKQHVAVVRNVPIQLKALQPYPKNELGLSEHTKMLIIQGSGLNVERGIEEAILAMAMIEDAVLYLVGNGDVIPKAKEMVKSYQLENKIVFVGRLPYHEMMRYTAAADLGLALDKPLSLNYQLALPNKVFDYLQAQTPILASPLIEIERIIQQYDCGELLQNVDPEAIAQKVQQIFSAPERLAQLKENCRKSAQIEHWEKDAGILKEVINAAFGAH
ncbi:MAG: glycosyltransferase [Flavobacteriales bacterium]